MTSVLVFLIMIPVLWRMGGHPVAQLVEALLYKPEGLGCNPDGVIEILHWHNPSGRTMALGLTQPLTEMSTRNISWEVKRWPVCRADNLTTFLCRVSWNLGASTSWNPQGLPRDCFTFYFGEWFSTCCLHLLQFVVQWTTNNHLDVSAGQQLVHMPDGKLHVLNTAQVQTSQVQQVGVVHAVQKYTLCS